MVSEEVVAIFIDQTATNAMDAFRHEYLLQTSFSKEATAR